MFSNTTRGLDREGPVRLIGAGSCRERSVSSLKERGRVNRGFCVGGGFWACVTGVSCFPGSCQVRGGRPGRSRTGRSPAAGGGAGGVLEVAGRVPDDLAAGKREPGIVRGHIRLSGSVPWWVPWCGQCRWLQSSLRVSPAAGRGRMGRVRVRRGGQAGSIKGAPALPGEGGGADTGGDLAPGRWPARAVHAARAGGLVTGGPRAWTGSGSARRAGRRTPGSGAGVRRRPWRCCGLPSRGGR